MTCDPGALSARLQEALQRFLRFRFGRPPGVTMIVGMHRSGTSFLTGELQQAGLELGKHSAWDRHNAQGNRENRDIVALHDGILQKRGFAWNRPPKNVVEWSPEERAEAQAIVNSYQGMSHWGFKDPRSLLLVEGWEALLPDLRFVGVFRHPVGVARSLKRRDKVPSRHAFTLWQIYNARLLALHQRRPFLVICFDDPPELLLAKVDRVAASIGLRVRPEQRFYNADLMHYKGAGIELPEAVAATLHALRKIAL